MKYNITIGDYYNSVIDLSIYALPYLTSILISKIFMTINVILKIKIIIPKNDLLIIQLITLVANACT